MENIKSIILLLFDIFMMVIYEIYIELRQYFLSQSTFHDRIIN
jgi:hypothetical protein